MKILLILASLITMNSYAATTGGAPDFPYPDFNSIQPHDDSKIFVTDAWPCDPENHTREVWSILVETDQGLWRVFRAANHAESDRWYAIWLDPTPKRLYFGKWDEKEKMTLDKTAPWDIRLDGEVCRLIFGKKPKAPRINPDSLT